MSHHTLPIELGGFWVLVEVDYSPGRPGTMYRRNGDPGDPPEPEELEVTEAQLELPVGVPNRLNITALLSELGQLDNPDSPFMKAVEKEMQRLHEAAQAEWDSSREDDRSDLWWERGGR